MKQKFLYTYQIWHIFYPSLVIQHISYTYYVTIPLNALIHFILTHTTILIVILQESAEGAEFLQQ